MQMYLYILFYRPLSWIEYVKTSPNLMAVEAWHGRLSHNKVFQPLRTLQMRKGDSRARPLLLSRRSCKRNGGIYTSTSTLFFLSILSDLVFFTNSTLSQKQLENSQGLSKCPAKSLTRGPSEGLYLIADGTLPEMYGELNKCQLGNDDMLSDVFNLLLVKCIYCVLCVYLPISALSILYLQLPSVSRVQTCLMVLLLQANNVLSFIGRARDFGKSSPLLCFSLQYTEDTRNEWKRQIYCCRS